jgi:hypothetical protein
LPGTVKGHVVRGQRGTAEAGKPRAARKPCVRCGLLRTVKADRPAELCADCRWVDPDFGKKPLPRTA